MNFFLKWTRTPLLDVMKKRGHCLKLSTVFRLFLFMSIPLWGASPLQGETWG